MERIYSKRFCVRKREKNMFKNREEFNIFFNTRSENGLRYEVFEGKIDSFKTHENEKYGWWMQQHDDEFWDLLELLRPFNIQRVLEIGSNHGGTLPFFDQFVGENGLVVGVDRGIDDRFFSVI